MPSPSFDFTLIYPFCRVMMPLARYSPRPTHALSQSHLLGAVEPLEHIVVVLLRDADAGVGDVHPRVELPGPHRHRHFAAGRRVLHGIVQDVANGLRRPLGVVLHCDGWVAFRRQVDLLRFGLGPDGAHGLGDGVGEPCFLYVQRKCPGFQPGHFDEGLHQEVKLVDLPVHRSQELRPLFRR